MAGLMRLAPVAAFALLLACATPPRAPAPLGYAAEAETWPSGARVVALSVPHRPDVIVGASYRTGSADDPPGKEGLAHLVEHLAFDARPGGGARVWERLEALGAELDGRTRADATDFHAAADPEALDALLAVEADRLRDPLAGLDPAALERERAVVLQELLSDRGPASTAGQVERVAARAFPGHALGRGETPASLRALGLDDVRAFARERYRPERLVLVVIGPQEPAALRARARAAFGALAGDPASPVPPDTAPPPAPDLAREVDRALAVEEAPVERPALWLAWAVPADDAHGGARARAAVRFLEARLAAVVEGREADRALGLDLHAHGLGAATLVLGRVALRRPEDARRVADAVRDELRFHRWADDLPDRERLRGQLVLDAFVRLEALDPSEVARWFRATGRADYLRALPAAIGAGLEGDTRRWVGRWLAPDRLVALAVVPGGAPLEAAAAPAGAGEAGGAGEHHAGAPDAEPADLAGLDPARALRPPRLDAAPRRRLANGLEVVIAPRPGFRVVSVRLVARTPPAGPLERVLETLALRSATCSDKPATVAGDVLAFGARAPAELLPEALDQVACRARPPAVDGPAFDEARDRLAELLERTPPRVHERAGQALLERLYPGHPYAREVTAAAVRRLDAGDAGRALAAALRPDRAALVIAGDVEPTPALWRELEARFGGWRARGGADPAAPPAPLPPARAVVLVDRPGWPTAELTVGVRIPPRAARDEPAFRTLAWRLRDRLRTRLRVEEALTYRAAVSVLEGRLGSSLLVSSAVPAGRAADALRTVLDALAAAGTPPEGDALRRAGWQAVREVARGVGTSFRNAARLEEAFVHGLPADEWDTFAARAARLDAGALRAHAATWSIGAEVVVVIGDAEKVAPLLRGAGLAPEVLVAPPR